MSTLNIAASGLKAFTKAQELTAHNIANSNTDGFIRQQAQFTEITPRNGVLFGSRVNDFFAKNLNDNIFNQAGDVGFQEGLEDGLSLIPSDSVPNLISSLTDFTNATQELANNPDDLATRNNFLAASNILTDNINDVNNTIADATTSSQQALSFAVDEINTLTNSIAKAQQQGINSTADIEALGKLIAINTQSNDGTITTDNGLTLVQQGRNTALTLSDISTESGGYVGGLSSIVYDFIPQVNTLLNDAMSTFINNINDEYAPGTDLNGSTGNQLFNESNGVYSVIPQTANEVVAGTNTEDNSIALNMLAAIDGRNQTNFTSIQDELLGADSVLFAKQSNTEGSLARELTLLNSLTDTRQSKYGVDLDQEAINMIKYNRAYEAMAKVIQTDNAMFRSLLDAVG